MISRVEKKKASSPKNGASKKTKKKKDLVILLHGLLCPMRQMSKLAEAFNKAGMDTLNIDYKSTKTDFDAFVDLLHSEIEKHCKEHAKIHFIGFSMGGVLTRLYLEKYPPAQLGRVLFLGSPMKGSALIDRFHTFLPLTKIIGFAGSKLAHEHPALPRTPVPYEAGAIAGDKGHIPFVTDCLGEKHDGCVSVESAKVEGMKDFIILPVDHYSFTNHSSVIEQSVRFIQKGTFNHRKKYAREYHFPNFII